MNSHIHSLAKCRLFTGIPDEAYPDALRYLHARRKDFQRGEIILHIGDKFSYAGLILDGVIECSYQDEAFNKFTMNHFSEGEMFGEAMSCAEVAVSPMQVMAVTDCVIIFLDFRRLHESGVYQARLSMNPLHILSGKNIFLNQKVRILSRKDLRGKITSYLHTLTPDPDGKITLQFTKTALAEFLCVNRTALSRELSRMCREGIISMNGRDFILREKCAVQEFSASLHHSVSTSHVYSHTLQ